MKTLKRLLVGLSALVVVGLLVVLGTSAYYGGDDGQGCARCHEIRPMVDAWAASTHRGVACRECHGSSLTAQVRMHAKNLQRVWLHARGETPEQIRLRQQDVVPMVERCGACHRQQRADWESGPHGVPYAALFINPEHNANQQLMDDCLRCHAMHFDGGITALVTPIDREGPWTFVDPDVAGLPAIPCLTCHVVHRRGEPLGPRTQRVTETGPEQEIVLPSLALYDRRSLEHVPVLDLPLPAMREDGRPVRTSPDPPGPVLPVPRAPGRQRGLLRRRPNSCQACHAGHGMTTRASCSGCHPRLSNCGRDVETMDTTFRSPDSPHDVHRVTCEDCHPKGVPKRRAGGPRTLALRLD